MMAFSIMKLSLYINVKFKQITNHNICLQKDFRAYMKLLYYIIEMMDDIEYGWERLKDIVEKEASKEDGADLTPGSQKNTEWRL